MKDRFLQSLPMYSAESDRSIDCGVFVHPWVLSSALKLRMAVTDDEYAALRMKDSMYLLASSISSSPQGIAFGVVLGRRSLISAKSSQELLLKRGGHHL